MENVHFMRRMVGVERLFIARPASCTFDGVYARAAHTLSRVYDQLRSHGIHNFSGRTPFVFF